MAYIDPEGMFGGDRMALLSDSAKMAWPWFWCASNTVGRVELNYGAFLRGPFRQFRKPPSEKQFWEWVEELHEAVLLFVYQSNGQAWGQWDVTARYLPKYKTKSDERTPAPIAKDFLAWRDQYQRRKASDLASKCRIFSVSDKFTENAENSEEFPIGVGEGRGVGEGEIQEQRAPETGALVQMPSPSRRPTKAGRTIEQVRQALGVRLSWFEAICSVHPAGRDGVKAGMEAFERKVTADDAGHQLAKEMYRGAVAYASRCAADPTMKPKWLQGWINDERWTDENRARDSPIPARHRDLVANVSREIQESLLKGEQPW